MPFHTKSEKAKNKARSLNKQVRARRSRGIVVPATKRGSFRQDVDISGLSSDQLKALGLSGGVAKKPRSVGRTRTLARALNQRNKELQRRKGIKKGPGKFGKA